MKKILTVLFILSLMGICYAGTAYLHPAATESPSNNSIFGIDGSGVKDFFTTFKFDDSGPQFYNVTDSTKQAKVLTSGITTGETRTMTWPDFDFTPARSDGANTFSGDQTIGADAAGYDLTINSTLGSEIAPALSPSLWTTSDGWSTGENTLIKEAGSGTGTATPSGTFTITAGTTYKVVVTCSAVSGSINYTIGGASSKYLTATTQTEYLTAYTSAKIIFSGGSTTTCTITALSVKAVTDGTGNATINGKTYINGPIIGSHINLLNNGGSSYLTHECFSSVTAASPALWFVRSASAALGTYSTTADTTVLGTILFRGTNYATPNAPASAASIVVKQDGTQSGGDTTVPAYMAFSTCPGGSTANTERMRIDKNGQVGIGLTPAASTGMLQIQAADGGIGANIKINATSANVTDADTFINFASSAAVIGSIAGTGSEGVIAYNTFTGSHYTRIKDKKGLKPNMLLEIIPGKFSDQKQLFNTRICSTRKSKATVGVYGGTNKQGNDMCLSIGTGYMIIANKGRNIEIGDLLISSDVKGCAELQDDDLIHNYTIGKATENVKWRKNEMTRTISVVYLGG